jgi:hypothetical protein
VDNVEIDGPNQAIQEVLQNLQSRNTHATPEPHRDHKLQVPGSLGSLVWTTLYPQGERWSLGSGTPTEKRWETIKHL